MLFTTDKNETLFSLWAIYIQSDGNFMQNN